jgi:uncharacterized membrane protein required for colicin V production
MIGFLVLVLLLVAFYSGARRGTSLQLVSVLGYFFSFLVAVANYRTLAGKIELFVPYLSVTADSKLVFYNLELALDLDKAYYAAVAFIMILFAGWLVTRLICIFANGLLFKRLRFLRGYDWVIAGIMNAALVYINIYLFLMILSMIPLATIQNIFDKSSTAHFIVESSPILSDYFYHLWITSVIG